jgi:hypothetical protein
MLVRATKEGWDGRQIRQVGEIFRFEGKRGSWMVPCDQKGNPIAGETLPDAPRDVRQGTAKNSGQGRDDLRAECKRLGIQFKATHGAVHLAELIRLHQDGSSTDETGPSGMSDDENSPEVDHSKGVGNQDVI